MEQEDKRLIDMDAMKIFAILFVLFNHTGGNGYFVFMKCEVGTLPFILSLFLSIFCKFTVPIFFMISGALLLKKDGFDFKRNIKKIFKVLFIIVLFSLLRKWSEMHHQQFFKELSELCAGIFVHRDFSVLKAFYDSFDPGEYTSVLKKAYVEFFEGDLLFLYLYVEFLFIFPFLHLISKKIEKEHFYYLVFLIVFFGGIVPCLEYLFTGEGYLLSPILRNGWIFAFVPLLGYYAEFKLDDVSGKSLIVLWGVNLLAIAVSMYLTYRHIYGVSLLFTENYHKLFYVLNALTIFLTFKKYCRGVPPKAARVFSFLSKSVFTVYLMHVNLGHFLPDMTNKLQEYIDQGMFPSAVLLITGSILLNYVCGVLIWFSLSKTPVLKKLTYV